MDIDRDTLMLMLRRMWMIRNFELKVMEVHSAGEFTGAAHPYIGEEAVAVGACAALKDTDYITGNHRSHGHPIAKGGRVDKAMAELYGRVDGYCKGKGGSMHLADYSIGILGESGILGSSVPVETEPTESPARQSRLLPADCRESKYGLTAAGDHAP